MIPVEFGETRLIDRTAGACAEDVVETDPGDTVTDPGDTKGTGTDEPITTGPGAIAPSIVTTGD